MKLLQIKPVFLIFAVILAVGVYLWGSVHIDPNQQQGKSPCTEPLTFRAGNIDERFSITESELIVLMKDAEQVWSDAARSDVIAYDETGEIAVNLIYAEEQQLSDRERQYRDRLEQQEYSIASHEKEYEQMNQRYEVEMRQYQQESGNLQNRIDQLNEWVIQKNKQGGFTEDDLQRFEMRKNEIERTKRDLAQRETVLKQKADEINTKIDFLNNKIAQKNSLADEYNRMFSGERKFTQGAYEWTPGSRNINIFYFLDSDELRLVIAHEMGHALGMGHVSNPTSVMHELMHSQDRKNLTLSEQDLHALQDVCGNQMN